jgi:hypothetical protein
MASGGHGLPKVSPLPAMLYPSMPCRQATPETALSPLQEWPARRAGSLWPSFIPLDTPRRTPMKSHVIMRKMSTPCIYVTNLMRIEWKMMPQWSKTCIFSLVLSFYATPRDRRCAKYCKGLNVNILIYMTSLGALTEKRCLNGKKWRFLVISYALYASLCHATSCHVTVGAPNIVRV